MKQVMALLPLALAACSGGGEAGNNGTQADESAVVEAAPSNLQDDPNNSVVPIGNTASALPAAEPATAIPAAFRGRWGMVPNDCDPARDDAKGLMTVTGDRLTFYESRATIADARAAGDMLTATLSFSGEGQTWRQQAQLVLQDGGRTLVRDGTGEGMQGGPFRYARCPEPGA